MSDMFGQKSSDPSEPGSELVTLRMPARDLGEFFASMLGQRRSVTKELHYNFEIDLNWVVNFVELISQRIAAQNRGDLISFDAAISYKDGKRVELTNINQLKHYSDVSNDISTSIRLNFTYLLKFPYKDAPERQDIEFFASSSGDDGEHSARGDEKYGRLRRILIPLNEDKSVLSLQVRHTDLTWGEDVINLISNHVDASFIKTGGAWDSLRLMTAAASPLIGLIIGAMLIATNERGNQRSKQDLINSFSHMFEKANGSLQSVDLKLNTLYKYFQAVEAAKGFNIGAFLLGSLSPIFVIVFLFLITRIRSSSYVILNKATENYARRRKKNRKILVTTLLTGVVLSVVTGIISTTIYDRMPPIW